MYDNTKFSNISNVEKWITMFKASLSNYRKNITVIMAMGKYDLNFKRAVPEKYAKNFKEGKFHQHFKCFSKNW